MKVKVRTREIWVQMKTNNSLMRRLKGLLTSGWSAFPLLIHCCRPGQSGYAQIRQKMNDTMVTVLLCHYRIKVLAHQQDHLSYFLSRRSQASTKRMPWNQSCWPKYPACYRYFTSYFFCIWLRFRWYKQISSTCAKQRSGDQCQSDSDSQLSAFISKCKPP